MVLGTHHYFSRPKSDVAHQDLPVESDQDSHISSARDATSSESPAMDVCVAATNLTWFPFAGNNGCSVSKAIVKQYIIHHPKFYHNGLYINHQNMGAWFLFLLYKHVGFETCGFADPPISRTPIYLKCRPRWGLQNLQSLCLLVHKLPHEMLQVS